MKARLPLPYCTSTASHLSLRTHQVNVKPLIKKAQQLFLFDFKFDGGLYS